MRDKPIDENSLMANGLLRLSWLLERADYATVAGKALSCSMGTMRDTESQERATR